VPAILKRLFHIPEMIILMSVTALACLPLALSNIVRDAGITLLLPVTVIGVLLAWALVMQKVRRLSSGIILLGIGPAALFIRIGHMSTSLFEILKQTIFFFIDLVRYKTHVDFSPLLLARDDFIQRIFAFTQRLTLWVAAFLHGIRIEDPVVRTLTWSMALWLIAIWAGWQIYHNKRLLAGMLPSTVVLALVLNQNGKGTQVLWLHLALLLFLIGLTSYANLQNGWKTVKTDYSESTGADTLIFVGALTLALVTVSFLASTISVKDILDDLRDKNKPGHASPTPSPRVEGTKNKFMTMGFEGGLPRFYLVSAGPELSHQLAMTISTGDLPPLPAVVHLIVPRYYWRTFTYQIYTGAGWTNPAASTEDIPSEQPLFDTSALNYRIVKQKVTFPNENGGRLYWTGTLVSADVPFQAAWVRKDETDPLLNSDLLAALAPVKSYLAQSLLLDVNANQLRAAPTTYPDWVRRQFLVLPDSVPERVLALARDLTASEPSTYDRALAIQDYLRKFPYTLDVGAPPTGRDVADYFLFDLKRGYCDYYATTMVVLARAAGLPARLVVGYANGFYDVEHAYYTVTENYAHSWVEIYFANIGWVEFEPTASEPAIVYPDESGASTPKQGLPAWQPFKPFNGRFVSFFRGLNLWPLAGSLIVVMLIWIVLDSLHVTRLDPARALQLLYRRLRLIARPLIGIASRDQTVHQYASTLIARLTSISARPRLQNWFSPSQNEIDQLTELYSQSLFAPSPLTHADVVSAAKIWSRLRWRLLLANIVTLRKV